MNTALLIVDVQNGFITGQCANIPVIVSTLQNSYSFVATSRFYNEPNSPFRTLMGWNKVAKNDSDYQLAFNPENHVFVYDKPGYSSVTPELEIWLKDNDIEKIIVCGINTEVCVLHTATELFLKKYNVYVLAEACGSTKGAEYHNGGLLAVRHCIGDQRVI